MKHIDYRNMKEALDAAEARDQNRVVVKMLRRKTVVEIGAKQFYGDIHKYASAFLRLGIQGKHVGVTGENSYEYLVTMCALFYIGSVAVLLCKDYNTKEILKYCRKTDTNILIYSEEREEDCLPARSELTLIAMHETKAVDIPSLQTEKEKELLAVQNMTDPEDLSLLIFTSGTTGESKAVMHTNRSLLAGVIDPYFDEPADSFLVVFPFHHVGGYCVALQALFTERIICLGDSPAHTVKYLETMKPEYVFVVPAMMQVLCQKLKKKPQEELGWSLRILACGGAKIIPDDLDLVLRRGIKVYHSYAASETSGRCIGGFAFRENLETLGKPVALIEADIQEGELLLGGPSVFAGYYKDEDQTRETLKNGWYYTGDLAQMDKDGYYYLIGRKKNLIILSNGENVSPEEIETILYQHSELQEILVREENDCIGVVIYPNYSECEQEEDRENVRNRIGEIVEVYNDEAVSYKQIHNVTISDEPLPKTATGKIKRI